MVGQDQRKVIMRKWRRWSLAVSLICLLGVYPLLAPPTHRIDKNHFELIGNGMTLADVESIFGQPAGNYDWAVADDARVWSIKFSQWSRVGAITEHAVVNEINFELLTQVAPADAPAPGKRRIIWTNLAAEIRTADALGWTSRHGACTIWFDQHGRVSRKSEWGESHAVPPWRTWWQKLFGE